PADRPEPRHRVAAGLGNPGGMRSHSGGHPRTSGLALRQLIVGIIALPLSAVPFLAYLNLTPEGRLVRDKVLVKFSPPRLPALSPEVQREAASIVPDYRGKVMALVYHGIGSGSDAEGGYVVSPGTFADHLAMLRAAGMHPVTAADIA